MPNTISKAEEDHRRSYLEGLRDGQIQELESRVDNLNTEMRSHELRLRILEKISYAMLGVVALIEVFPAIQHILKP